MKTPVSFFDVKFHEGPSLKMKSEALRTRLALADVVLFGGLAVLLGVLLSCYGVARYITIPAEKAKIVSQLDLPAGQVELVESVLNCSFAKALDEVSATSSRRTLLRAEHLHRFSCYQALTLDTPGESYPSGPKFVDEYQVGLALAVLQPR